MVLPIAYRNSLILFPALQRKGWVVCSRARGLIRCTVTLDALSSRARPMGDMAYCSFLKNGDKFPAVKLRR